MHCSPSGAPALRRFRSLCDNRARHRTQTPRASVTHMAGADTKPEKKGTASAECSSKGEALVLLRNSKHNHNTWGLPGGNADKEDAGDLKTTALREAIEEMTVLPEFDVRGSVLTKRGKRLQKHYTVFVCELSGPKDEYVPTLNEEHSTWKWFPIDELRARSDLHPVVYIALHQHWDEVSSMIRASAAS